MSASFRLCWPVEVEGLRWADPTSNDPYQLPVSKITKMGRQTYCTSAVCSAKMTTVPPYKRRKHKGVPLTFHEFNFALIDHPKLKMNYNSKALEEPVSLESPFVT
jgi:hypothetical protein